MLNNTVAKINNNSKFFKIRRVDDKKVKLIINGMKGVYFSFH